MDIAKADSTGNDFAQKTHLERGPDEGLQQASNKNGGLTAQLENLIEVLKGIVQTLRGEQGDRAGGGHGGGHGGFEQTGGPGGFGGRGGFGGPDGFAGRGGFGGPSGFGGPGGPGGRGEHGGRCGGTEQTDGPGGRGGYCQVGHNQRNEQTNAQVSQAIQLLLQVLFNQDSATTGSERVGVSHV